MSELNTSVAVDLTGNLERQAQRYSRSMDRFSQRGQRSMSRLNRTVGTLGRGLDRMGNRWVGFAAGIGGVQALRNTANLEERFERLGVQGNITTEQVKKLQEELFDIARSPDIKIDMPLLASAIEEVVEKVGDLEFARGSAEIFASVIQATGDKTGVAVGGIAAEFHKMGIVAQDKLLTAFDILNVQGKEGAFTLNNLAQQGPRVVTAYTALGAKGVPAIRELGAVLQVIRQGVGGPEQAATSFEALLRVLSEADKIKILKQGGIDVFDPEKLKEGVRQIRPINQIMKEIVLATKGDRTVIQQVLGDAESVRAFNGVLAEFNVTGKFGSLDKFYNVTADGTTTLADSARLAKIANANMSQLGNTWSKLTSEVLDPLIKKIGALSDALGVSGQEAAVTGVVAGTGAAIVARKIFKTRGARKQAELASNLVGKTPAGRPPVNINRALGVPPAASSGPGVGRFLGRASSYGAIAMGAFDAGAWSYENLIKGRAIEYQAIEDWNKFIGLFGSAVEKIERAADKMETAKPKVEIEVKGDPVKNVKGSDNLEATVNQSVPLS